MPSPLTTELAKPSYTGKSNADCVALLNGPDRRSPLRSVPMADVLIWAAGNDVLKRLKAAAADPASPVNSIADAALRMFGIAESLEVGRPEIKGMFDKLVEAGVVTTAARDALLYPPRWASLNRIRPVTEADVAAARGG